MKALSRRQKLIGGAFALVTTVWTIDLLAGRQSPSVAGATVSTAASTQPVNLPADPPDLEHLIEALSGSVVSAAPLPGEELTRDLFVPTPRVEEFVKLAAAAAVPEPQEAAEQRAEPEPFETRHVLRGVLSGRLPLALIDDVLYARGAEVDGYRLLEIHGDRVILQQGQSRVELRVPAARAGR